VWLKEPREGSDPDMSTKKDTNVSTLLATVNISAPPLTQPENRKNSRPVP